MANKLNPYSKVVDSKSKPVLFSFTNFKEDRISAQKTLSLYMFMSQLIDEHDNWSEELGSLVTDKEQFKQHLSIFRDHFLKYNEQRDTTPVSHTGNDQLASLDFI